MSESKSEKNAPKKVTVLTGFLGSGKTTLLNAILEANKDTRFAIVENEVGEIGIDGDLIIKNTDSFTELSNGCICCSLNDNFVDTLRTLSKREDWDELIIEATGVANPGGIVAPFKQFPWIQKYFQLPDVICIADARHVEEQLNASRTAGEQLAYGDKVYLSKVDLVDQERVEEVKELVQSINPFAHFCAGSRGDVPVEVLLERVDSLRPVIQLGGLVAPPVNKEVHLDEVNSISLEYDLPFNENLLAARLHSFLAFQSESVFRFKGIFYDPRKDKKIIAQSVMQSLFMEDGEPWEEEEVKTSRFVFIGKGLQKKGFDKMLMSCLLKET